MCYVKCVSSPASTLVAEWEKQYGVNTTLDLAHGLACRHDTEEAEGVVPPLGNGSVFDREVWRVMVVPCTAGEPPFVVLITFSKERAHAALEDVGSVLEEGGSYEE